MSTSFHTTTKESNDSQNIKQYESGLSDAVSYLQKVFDTLNRSDDNSLEAVQQVLNKQPMELQAQLKKAIPKSQKMIDAAQKIADGVIREEPDLSPEVEAGLTEYLSCLQEALQIVQKSNASTLEGLENEISKNKNISKGARAILNQEVKHLSQLNIPGAQPTISNLQKQLQEGIKDIKALHNNIKDLRVSPDVNKGNVQGKEAKNPMQALLNNAVANTKNLLLGKSDLTEISLSQMHTLALSMEKALKGHKLEVGVGRNIDMPQRQESLERNKALEKDNEVKTAVDNTNIEYSEKGLGEHTEVVVQQEKTVEGASVEKDASAALREAKNAYMNKSAYDRFKDGDLKISQADVKAVESSVSGFPIIGEISEQNPSAELRSTSVENPSQNGKDNSKGGRC